MPDHDLFDLDDAFSSLERDIASVSSPRGAGQAVSSARRRRRTTYGAVAAVGVLAVCAVAIGQGVGGRSGAVAPSKEPLPPATPLTAGALSAATAGWVDGWGKPSTQARTLDSVTCFANHNNGALDQATRGGETVYGAGSTEIAYVVGLELPADKLEAARAAVTASAEGCKPTAESTTTYADGSTVTFYQLPAMSGSGDVELWTAQYDDRLAIGLLGGTTNEPPADVVDRVDALLVGALQVDSTFTSGSSVGVPDASKSAAAAPFGAVSEPDFAAALGAWPNGWQQTGTRTINKELSCAGDWTVGSSSGEGSSLGGNGEQDFYSFDTVDNARSSLQALAANLRTCTTSTVVVRTVTGTGTVPVTVAVESGNDDRVTWIVQRGATVGYVTIPATSSPPDPVSEAVGALVDDVLGHVSEGPPPIESSGPVPTQQDNGSSSSSSSTAPPKS
jgi:hypothetical protein